jgi:alkanesulfonate monooxygenase SsuD/methylene tetrahydromethanopterin reductase-like flavin-dependent oxidoreductase (luciferase family)
MRFGLFGGARTSRGPGGVGNGPGDTTGDSPGYSPGDSHGYEGFIEYVTEADRLGFHSLFMVEHHFTGHGQVSASMTILAYLAARTQRIRLGTAVVVLPWHDPVLVAEQAATLDLLSGGRFDFGVGKGYRPSEFEGFCIPMEEATERFEEAMAVIRKAWTTEGRFSHDGKHWRYANIVVEPAPRTRPHPPLWLAAGSEDSIRRAAREGYNLLLDQLASVRQVIDRLGLFREECLRVGRPYDPMMVGVARGLQMFFEEEDRAAAIATRKRVLGVIGDLARGERPRSIEEDDSALLGTPAEIIARLRRLEEGGVAQILLADPNASPASLRAFARHVMPAFAVPVAPSLAEAAE